jgi:hypothetical protein
MMDEDRRSHRLGAYATGLSVSGAILTGACALFGGAVATMAAEFIGGGIYFLAAALTFGSLVNALLRR